MSNRNYRDGTPNHEKSWESWEQKPSEVLPNKTWNVYAFSGPTLNRIGTVEAPDYASASSLAHQKHGPGVDYVEVPAMGDMNPSRTAESIVTEDSRSTPGRGLQHGFKGREGR